MPKPSYVLILFTVLFGGFLAIVRPAARTAADFRPKAPVVVQNPSPDTRIPEKVVLRGSLHDRFGRPVGGAMIEARPAVGGEVLVRGETAADGSYALALADTSPVDLLLRAQGLGAIAVRRFPARRLHRSDTLGPELPWLGDAAPPLPPWSAGLLAGEGFVKNLNGELVPGALVVVEQTGLSARTDDNGRFRVGLPGQSCTLRVRSTAGEIARVDLEPSTRPQGLVPVPDIVLRPGLALEGMVTRPDGSVGAGVTVRVEAPGIDLVTVSDAAGGFHFVGLSDEPATLTGRAHDGALPVRTVVRPGGDASIVHLQLLAERPLRVQVVREGLPVPGVHVYCTEESGLRRGYAQADDQGIVQLRGLAGRAPSFEVRADGTWEPQVVRDYDAAAGILVLE